MSLELADILAAQQRIAAGVCRTPCPESIPLSELCGARIYCKLDYLQRTGSFKERGARNALLLLSDEERRRGVVAASAGNHALGLAYHGQLLGVPVTVVMPKFAPLIKIATCRRLGAEILLHGQGFEDARLHAVELSQRQGRRLIHGFDDPAIIAGQGTLGLEILDQVPDVEAIVVPVGGAGLIAGVGLAVKSLKPAVQVIGVEPAAAASLQSALAAGGPTKVQVAPTLADGLAVPQVGALAFALAARFMDRLVTVTEEELALSVLRLAELEKSVVEGASAASLAACLRSETADLAGKKVALVLGGGNIDPLVLTRVIEKGLVSDGRLCRFTAVVPDRPGGLAHLAQVVAAAGASVQQIGHDRAFAGPNVAAVHVSCTVETNDREHIAQLYAALKREGITVVQG